MNNELTLFDDNQLPQEQSEQVIFDYHLLSAEKREFVLQKTDETQWLLKKTAENIIKIGKNLLAVQAVLPHGSFLPWLQSEFGMSQPMAYNYIHVAERFDGKFINFINLASSALYLLAAPSTPESAVNQALELAESGKKVTHAMAQKLIEAEKAKELAEAKAAAAIADAEIAQQKLFAVKTETETKITELSEQITALQQEMTTLTTPPTEYVDKLVWPEDKANELKDLQVKLNELNTNLEAEKKAIPEATQKELDSLKKQLDSLKAEKQQQELLNKAQEERLKNLDSQLKIAIKDRITSENDERIRQEWRSITSEARSCLMRLLGSWPTSLDIHSFESDDWERLSQLKSTLKRVLEECDNLNYGGDDMIVESPIAYIEAGNYGQQLG